MEDEAFFEEDSGVGEECEVSVVDDVGGAPVL